MNGKPSIYDQSLESLQAWIRSQGEPAYRARQIWHGLYRTLANAASDLTDLPQSLRERLADSFAFQSLALRAEARSQDGRTVKELLELPGGNAIESVLMRYAKRRTACISSQAGCAMGCAFCATGQMGFVQNLDSGQIVEQVLRIERRLRAEGEHLTNIVVMGMGEPFHNYDAVMQALDRLNHPLGLHFGARRITVSTVGLVPAIERYTAEKRRYNLAVSLHAATDELRSKLLPINRRYPLDMLMEACRSYGTQSGRRITFEWALIEGVNDDTEQARILAARLKGMLSHVNLIPLNPTQGYRRRPSQRAAVQRFQQTLGSEGIACTVRMRRGIEIRAGCGQLAVKEER